MLRQSTHWDLIEGIVWLTNLEMKDRICLFTYSMTYGTFMYLVRKLESFVKSKATMFVKTPLKLRKTIGLLLYQFAHGVSSNNIANRFNVGVFTMLKYVDIVPHVLIFF